MSSADRVTRRSLYRLPIVVVPTLLAASYGSVVLAIFFGSLSLLRCYDVWRLWRRKEPSGPRAMGYFCVSWGCVLLVGAIVATLEGETDLSIGACVLGFLTIVVGIVFFRLAGMRRFSGRGISG